MKQGIDRPCKNDRSQFDYDKTDTGPQFERITQDQEAPLGDTNMHPGTRSRKTSRESGGKLFTITDKARIVAASKERWIGLKDSRNLARVAIDNAYFDTYKPRQVKSTVAQLVDLEEDMAKDDFDYSVFVKREVQKSCVTLMIFSYEY